MKTLLTLSLLLPSLAFGQSLAGTTPQNRTALLEEFTGIGCSHCPDGHAVMNSVALAHPGKVSLVGIHAGGFAGPAPGWPDFRTAEGTALHTYYAVSAAPMAVTNRRSFSGEYVRGRQFWSGDVAAVLAMPSPVNLGMESSYDIGTQQLTVHVQLYYTSNSPGGSDRISVLVTEDHLIGPQFGAVGDYDHMHVLRGYFTDLWGEAVNTTTAGTTVDRTYSLSVPDTWNIANCSVTAFVGEYMNDVYQARTVAAPIVGSLGPMTASYKRGTPSAATTFSSSLHDPTGSNAQYVVSVVPSNAPPGWGYTLEVGGNTITNGTLVDLGGSPSVTMNVKITPNTTPGIGHYLLKVASVEFPDAMLMQQEFHLISGVHDLIVTNPGAEPWKPMYSASMLQAGEAAFAHATREQFIKFGEANALGDVLNIYRNVGWTFPSLTNDEVAMLATLMDNGVNLMIAGQDIGWDQSGAANSFGTPETQSFYSDYMLASFVDNGSSASNTVNFTDTDPIFGAIGNCGVMNVFSGNTMPDEIIPIAPATGILTYNGGSSIGGLRAMRNNVKLVYFGVGPEQMSPTSIGRSMIQVSHDWFYGMVGIGELDASIGSLGHAYPVPADGQLNIPVNGLRNDATLEVFDAMGRVVFEQNTLNNVSMITLNTSVLSDGVYSYRLRNAGSTGAAKSFVVSH